MKIFSTQWSITGIRYALTLVIVVGAIIGGAKLFHIPDMTWALISGVVCTELELDQVRTVMIMRILATIVGVILAILILLVFGSGYLSIILGVAITTMFCYFIIPLKNSWKLASATGVLVLIAALQQHSVNLAEMVALNRALEVIAGSLVAGVISFTVSKLWSKLSQPR